MKSQISPMCVRSSKMALITILEHKLTQLHQHLATAQQQLEKYTRLGNKKMAKQYERTVACCAERIDAVRDTIMRQKQLVRK